MRLISQNGLVNAPFENSIIRVDKEMDSFVIYIGTNSKPVILGQYDTLNRAEDVLEDMNAAFLRNERCYHFPKR